MSKHLDLVNSFFRVLNQQGKYAFFDYQVGGQAHLSQHSLYDLLIRPEDIEYLLRQLSTNEKVRGVSLSSSFGYSQALINLDGGDLLQINFTHRFIYKSLVYLDPEEVLTRKTFNPTKGCFQPSIEHLFEFAILKHYLRFQGWNERMIAFFDDFHVLIKEDLIDFFNHKYQTSFRSLDDIADFDKRDRGAIINRLKNLPTNEFLKTINVRWHNFMGIVRQAKII